MFWENDQENSLVLTSHHYCFTIFPGHSLLRFHYSYVRFCFFAQFNRPRWLLLPFRQARRYSWIEKESIVRIILTNKRYAARAHTHGDRPDEEERDEDGRNSIYYICSSLEIVFLEGPWGTVTKKGGHAERWRERGREQRRVRWTNDHPIKQRIKARLLSGGGGKRKFYNQLNFSTSALNASMIRLKVYFSIGHLLPYLLIA